MDYITTTTLVKHFGSVKQACNTFSPPIKRGTWWTWKEKGVPELRQRQLVDLSGGKLKLDPQYHLNKITKVQK